jgi:rare lipoprotein A (peptidoglycan hydrolase)
VVVSINDRGPYAGGMRRITELSETAARRIGIREHGIEWVEVAAVRDAS